jgi:hypothetical protein
LVVVVVVDIQLGKRLLVGLVVVVAALIVPLALDFLELNHLKLIQDLLNMEILVDLEDLLRGEVEAVAEQVLPDLHLLDLKMVVLVE